MKIMLLLAVVGLLAVPYVLARGELVIAGLIALNVAFILNSYRRDKQSRSVTATKFRNEAER